MKHPPKTILVEEILGSMPKRMEKVILEELKTKRGEMAKRRLFKSTKRWMSHRAEALVLLMSKNQRKKRGCTLYWQQKEETYVTGSQRKTEKRILPKRFQSLPFIFFTRQRSEDVKDEIRHILKMICYRLTGEISLRKN